jgi:hypothetical protein
MNLLFWFLLLVPSQSAAADEGVTGFFLTIKCQRNLQRHREILTSKSVCLPPSPIIYPKEFESISVVQEFGGKVFFDLKFTPKGYEMLLKVTENLPESKLALVVADQVFYVVKASELRVAPAFRFQAGAVNKETMEDVHRQLMSAMLAAER